MFSNLLKKLVNWLKTNRADLFFTSVILFAVIFIAFKNYTPGTFLTGWDNLHPEFNFKLNIERSLNAVWQEYQGVGLLGGMSHAADLPRQIVLWGLSLIVPISFIRYLWTFAMLLIGPLGVYFLLKDKSKFGGFAASIFYIFNLATVQYFFVPFETFTAFFGFLPWLIYTAINYLNTGKGIWKYLAVSLLATSAFYVQTLFIVYAVFSFVLCLKNLKRSIWLVLSTFLINVFWLVPVIWFTVTSGGIPSNSDINRIATPETILMNQARTDFYDVVNFKGYWFDYYDFGKDEKFDYLFKTWIDYSNKPYIKEIGTALFAVSVIGLILSGEFIWPLLLAVGYLMLSGFSIPVPVLEEAFRNSFTKWSVAFSFLISVGLGYFVAKFKKLSFMPAILIIVASVYSVWPITYGKLISERVRVSIPNAYFETFNWFNNETKGDRIAYFPAFDKWGWNYHNWGYGGSGFIWYGIKNPILDRAFNVWSPNNESYYNEVTKAILDENKDLFKSTLEKYKVKYLLLDESIIYPWGDKNLLKIDTIKSFTESLGYKEVYKNGFITVYNTGINNQNHINTIDSYTSINANLNYSKIDYIYQKYGNYVSDVNGLGLPFFNLDSRGDVKIAIEDNNLVFSNSVTNSRFISPITKKTEEDFSGDHGYKTATNCELMKLGSVERENLNKGRKYTAKDGGISCDYFVFDKVSYNTPYILHLSGENLEGRSLKIYLYNWESKRVELEELLPSGNFDSYFVIYPKIDKGLSTSSGYTLNVETRSFGKIHSQNIINTIEFIPFDLNLLQGLYIEPKQQETVTNNNLEIKSVNKYGTAIYKIDVVGRGILQLGQGFDSGWVSYPKLEHVKLNGWSNGFKVDNDGTYYIFFWPQFLEWGGFLLLLLTLSYMIVKSKE